jgi:two-component system KDP operon response regulator KdpE
MSRILCIDDEPSILRLLAVVLSADGHESVIAKTGRDALALARHGDIDAVLLDLGLPDRDGLELITALQSIASSLPILVLSARSDSGEKVAALDLGAVDYITKPFDGDELRARLRVALRQRPTSTDTATIATYGPIHMDLERRETRIADRLVLLTPKEFALLKTLVDAGGRVLTHAALLDQVWGQGHREDVEYLRVAIRSLRMKIEDDPSQPRLIKNEPGIGYRLVSSHTFSLN